MRESAYSTAQICDPSGEFALQPFQHLEAFLELIRGKKLVGCMRLFNGTRATNRHGHSKRPENPCFRAEEDHICGFGPRQFGKDIPCLVHCCGLQLRYFSDNFSGDGSAGIDLLHRWE